MSPKISTITTKFTKQLSEYADIGHSVFGRALEADGIAADAATPADRLEEGDIVALGVISAGARAAGVKMNGAQAIRAAEANGHVFVTPGLARHGATVAADAAPLPRDTASLGEFERPRKMRTLTQNLSLYTPPDAVRLVRHEELIESFHAVIIGDDGEDIPITQSPKTLVSDPASLYLLAYERATSWHPITGTSHINTPRQGTMDTESLLDVLEGLYRTGNAALPQLRSLTSSPRTLGVLEHVSDAGVSYTPASVAEQDAMADDFQALIDAILVSNEGSFTAPDTMFMSHAVWSGTNKSARASSLTTDSQKALKEKLDAAGIRLVLTPQIARRVLLTRVAGEMSAVFRIGDAQPRLLHTYPSRAGMTSIVGMRTGGLYTVMGAESIAADLPA